MPRVLFIPGLPGSELRRRRADGSSAIAWLPGLGRMVPALDSRVMSALRAPDDLATDDGVFAGRPIHSAARFLGFDLMKQAGSLYTALADLGVRGPDLVRFGWDWRRPVTDDAFDASAPGVPASAVPALARLLESQADPVTLIVHSTGGLLARHCLERHPTLADRVERIVAFGVPWGGTLKSLAALVGRQGFGPIGARDAQRIFSASWAAFDLLPRRSGVALVVDGAGDEVDLLGQTDWTREIPNDPDGALGRAMRRRCAHSLQTLGLPAADWTLPVDLVNIVGWGKKTLISARLAADQTIALDPGGLDNESGHAAEDGCPATDEASYAGDGTVPLASAAWLRGDRVTHYYVPIGALAQVTRSNRRHSSLWRNPGAHALLARHLAGEPFAGLAHAAVDWRHKVDPSQQRVRIRYVMQTAAGEPAASAVARVETVDGVVSSVPGPDGRGFVEIPRVLFPKTGTRRFRRVVVRLEGASFPSPGPQAMFIEP